MRCCCSPRAGCCLGAAVPRRYTISPRGLSRALQLDCTVAGQVIADDMLDQVVRAMPLLFLPLALPTLNWLVLSAVPTWANFPLTLSLALLCPGCHEVNIGRARARVSPSCNADRPSSATPPQVFVCDMYYGALPWAPELIVWRAGKPFLKPQNRELERVCVISGRKRDGFPCT